jgi:hypothetical protein
MVGLTLVETGTYTHSMTLGRHLAMAACLIGTLANPDVAAAQAIERAMTVTVVDASGAPVPDLGIPDFIVREDNMAREVLRVGKANEPMHIALLVDTSTASRDNIAHFRTALPAFVTQLTNPNESGAKNQVAIIAIGERPTVITDYTSSVATLQRGISRLWALDDTGAYLLDGILEVTEGFAKREAKRPVIVAVTQEGPELSYRQYNQVLGPLRDSGAAFHALVLGTPSASLDDETRSRNIVLDEGPRGTGGSREQLLTPMALKARFQQLATLLTHQYLVTFAHPDSLIPPERVTVAAKQPGMTARGTIVKDKIQQGRR